MLYERIKNMREDLDLTQQEIADNIKVNRRTYSGYEIGKRTIPPEILVKLANSYGVSIDYLLNLTDEKRPYPRK